MIDSIIVGGIKWEIISKDLRSYADGEEIYEVTRKDGLNIYKGKAYFWVGELQNLDITEVKIKEPNLFSKFYEQQYGDR